MKQAILAILFIVTIATPLWANCTHCGRRGHCDCGPHYQGKGAPPKGERERAPEPERGGYVAPPRNGTEVGESEGYGVQGFGLHFPPLTLKMPILQMPSVLRMRRRPRMLIESAEAPYADSIERAEFSEERAPADQERATDGGDRERGTSPIQRADDPSQKQPFQTGQLNHDPVFQQLTRERDMLAQRVRQLESMFERLESRIAPEAADNSARLQHPAHTDSAMLHARPGVSRSRAVLGAPVAFSPQPAVPSPRDTQYAALARQMESLQRSMQQLEAQRNARLTTASYQEPNLHHARPIAPQPRFTPAPHPRTVRFPSAAPGR